MSRAAAALLLAALALTACAPAVRRTAAPPQDGGPFERWISGERAACAKSVLGAVSSATSAEKVVAEANVAPERRDLWKERRTIAPAPGSVVAAPAQPAPAPDYFFHWIRDSALVMNALTDEAAEPELGPGIVRRWEDFALFSRRLQEHPSPSGEGEARFDADGSVDVLKWSRPQFDGPALRALALMRAESRGVFSGRNAAAAARAVIRDDLDFLAAHDDDGFDLWEEYRGKDFYALAVQAAALDEGARRALAAHDAPRASSYSFAGSRRLQELNAHWRADKSLFGFAGGPRTYWDGTRRPKPGDDLDAGVLLGALHGGRAYGPGSLLDDRVLATWIRLEDSFAELYPVNKSRAEDEGVLLGRYPGDDYVGGNPWVLVTLAAAEADYGVAARLSRTSPYPVTPLNLEFLARALKRSDAPQTHLSVGQDATADPAVRRALLRGLVSRGDDVLRALRRRAANPGPLPEQLDKSTGAPASAAELTWSCAAFLSATTARFEAAAASR